jgi:glycerophosphoryl diester phosphodiesterase
VHVIVLAHRGLPALRRPENTVAAVAAAYAAGADGVEVDLRLTSDGVLALSHDPDLRRVAGTPHPVASSSWLELRRAGRAGGLELARVEQVLAVAAGRRTVLEVKRPCRPEDEERTAAAVVAHLREAAGPLDVTVSSFSAPVLAAVRARLPLAGVRTALLGTPADRVPRLLRTALDAGHDEVHPHVLPLLAEPDVVTAAHGCGVAVVPWTVNRPAQLHRLRRLGVDGVITDVPVAARLLRDRAAAWTLRPSGRCCPPTST